MWDRGSYICEKSGNQLINLKRQEIILMNMRNNRESMRKCQV